jgi:hypothetical protein
VLLEASTAFKLGEHSCVLLLCWGAEAGFGILAWPKPTCTCSASATVHALQPPRGLGIRTLRHPHVTCSHSSRDEPEVSVGISFAKLPLSQQSLSMAFQILDKDEDGRISRWALLQKDCAVCMKLSWCVSQLLSSILHCPGKQQHRSSAA